MLNAMTPPQGPHQQANSPAGSPILLVQQQDSTVATTPPDNLSSPVSSPSSSSSSSSSSSASSTSSSSSSSSSVSTASSESSNLLSTASKSQAITSQETTNIRLGDDVNTSKRLSDETTKQQSDDTELNDQTKPVNGPISPTSRRSSAQMEQRIVTTTSQDNSSKQPIASSSSPTDADANAPALSLHQSASSSVSNNSQYQQHHHQHNSHQKPSGYHSQAYNNGGRFNNHNQHHNQHHHNSHNSQNSTINSNSINPSTSTNSATFSAIRSSNQHGHSNSHRHKNNHHQQNHNQQTHNQQSSVLSNGGLNRESQQHLPTPYNTVAASSSPASLSGSDAVARNTSTSISRHSVAPSVAGPPHYVEMHVYAGECVAFQLMDGQEQIITGPATMMMVSQQESPPVPIPVQVPHGHMIHQVADENGTLKHIIFSVMNCESNSHIDSNVINFPHETFRVDSLGELVSTSNNSIGVDCDGSNGEQPATSPSSKSTSASSDKIGPSNHYNVIQRQENTNLNAASIDDTSCKQYKETYKNSDAEQAPIYSNPPTKDKNLGSESERQPVVDNRKTSVQEQSYELAAQNLSTPGMIVGSSDVPADVDPSMLANSGQMLPPVDEQMYGYPSCACCCCYCDPTAEAAVAASGQPLHPSAQISTGAMIGQQDVMMMPPMQTPQPSLQHDAPASSSGIRSGRNMANGMAMSYHNHQANAMMVGSGQHQQSFHNHSHVAGHIGETMNNSGKAHLSKGARGPHSIKQHGNKPHQTVYDRHHGSYHHYNSQTSYNSVASGNSTQCYQPDASVTMGYKSSQLQASGAQAYQPIYSNYDNHSASYVTMANVVSSSISKSSSSSSQHATSGSSYRSSHGLYNSAVNRSYRNEHQTADLSNYNNETALAKRQHYSTSDKSTTGRYGSNLRAVNNSHMPGLHGPSTSISAGSHSISSGSVSPLRPARGNKQHNQFNVQSSNGLRMPHPNYHMNQTGKEVVQSSWNPKQNLSTKNLFVNSPTPSASDQYGQTTNKQKPIVSNNIPVDTGGDVPKDCQATNVKTHRFEEATRTVTASPYQPAQQQPNNTIQCTTACKSNKNDSTNGDTPSTGSTTNKVSKQSPKVSVSDSAGQSKKHIDVGKRVQETAGLSPQEVSRSSRGKQKKTQKDDGSKQRLQQQIGSTTRNSSDSTKENSESRKGQSQKKDVQKERQKSPLSKEEVDLVDTSIANVTQSEELPTFNKSGRSKSGQTNESSPQIENHLATIPHKPANTLDVKSTTISEDNAAIKQDQTNARLSITDSPQKSPEKASPVQKTSSKAHQTNPAYNESITQPLASEDPEDDILILRSIINEDGSSDKPTFSVSLRSSFSENNIQSLESASNAAKSTQTTPQKEAIASTRIEMDDPKSFLIDRGSVLGATKKKSDSKKKGISSSLNKSEQQVHLNSLPQIRMMNLNCVSITANSVCLRWSYIPAIAEKFGVVSSYNHHGHGKNSALMDHFVIESSSSKCIETNTLNSSKIVFQGCSMTCRINQLIPEKIYHFRVRRTALVSSDDMEHLAVSEILSVTLPSVQQQNATQMSARQKLNQQQHLMGEGSGQSSSASTSSNMGRGNTTSSHQVSTHSKHHHSHNQSIRIMSILKQCRNKLASSVTRVVQNSLSSYSDTKFAGLLLIIFTMFATLLAILIDYYIVAPVTE